MWRSKKVIFSVVLASIMLLGSLGGIALAADDEEEAQPQPETPMSALWDKVATILQGEGVEVTSEQLKASFAQAQEELQAEARADRLQNMVKEGKITQEEADELQEWWDAKPDIKIGPDFYGHGRFPGMGGMRGFGGPCPPAEAPAE